MRMSSLFSQTRRENPADAEISSHQLLIRAGFIRQLAAGIFSYLPLAQRSLRKLAALMHEEMAAIGGQEICMPVVNPAEIWRQSGRWQTIGAELTSFKDRNGHDLALAMTHEETLSSLAHEEIHSYKQLPALLYHIQTKWRDDPRPRAGLLRAREFTMLDSYSLDADQEGLDKQYQAHIRAYRNIFQRCQLPFRVVGSDSGMMGGQEAHEFMYLCEAGEDILVLCESCGYSTNRQIARFDKGQPQKEKALPLVKQATPHTTTIQALAKLLNIPPSRTAKAVFVMAEFSGADQKEEKLVFAVIRGDMEINESKLQKAIQADGLHPALEEDLLSLNVVAGYASPIGLQLPLVVVDDLIPLSPNLVAGANQDGFHYLNTNYGRDYTADVIADIAAAVEGSPCPDCGTLMKLERCVEIANIFKLGTRYSEPMQCIFLDRGGVQQFIQMGSYGIGLGRLLACIAEQHHDPHGLCWPASVAPFDVHLISIAGKNSEIHQQAEELYKSLLGQGADVLYDDRDERAGVKFNDADLIGIPLRVTISPQTIEKNSVEVKERLASQFELVALDSLSEYIQKFKHERNS